MKRIIIVILGSFLILNILTADNVCAQQQVLGETIRIENAENIIAVDNVCAWPNLTLFPDGSIIATIFNRPSHGREEGNADCYVSKDGGRTWGYAGTPAPHKPNENRMNLAAGLSNDGSLVVLVSGWGGKDLRDYIVPTTVCRSADGGRSWTRKGSVTLPEEEPALIPFGDIVRLGNNILAAPAYGARGRQSRPAYILYSYDDGYTWGDAVPLGIFGKKPAPYNEFNETTVLRLRPGRWLAAARTERVGDLQFLVSEDEGKTWSIPDNLKRGAIGRRMEHPAHLLRLNDGKILLTYGIRWGVHGVGVRVSDDEGNTWSAPMVPVYYGGGDGGYPASVQLEDGTIVTAYYCDANDNHPRYHMGVVRWRLPD